MVGIVGDKRSGRVWWCGSESIGRSWSGGLVGQGGTEAAGLHVTSHQRAGAELAGFEAAEAGAVLWPARGRAGRPLPRYWEERVGQFGGG